MKSTAFLTPKSESGWGYYCDYDPMHSNMNSLMDEGEQATSKNAGASSRGDTNGGLLPVGEQTGKSTGKSSKSASISKGAASSVSQIRKTISKSPRGSK